MRRVSSGTHRLHGTFRPDRHAAEHPNFRKQLAIAKLCDWELRARDLVGLSTTATAFVRRVDRDSMFNRKGGRVLLACARAMDEIAALEAAIRVEGESVLGSRNRPRRNPKCQRLKALEQAVARVLKRFRVSRDGVLQTKKSDGD